MYVGGGVEVAGLEVKGSRRWSRRDLLWNMF